MEKDETIIEERNRLIIARNRFRAVVVQLKAACEWVLGDDRCRRDAMGMDTDPTSDSNMVKCVREAVAEADAALDDRTLRRP